MLKKSPPSYTLWPLPQSEVLLYSIGLECFRRLGRQLQLIRHWVTNVLYWSWIFMSGINHLLISSNGIWVKKRTIRNGLRRSCPPNWGWVASLWPLLATLFVVSCHGINVLTLTGLWCRLLYSLFFLSLKAFILKFFMGVLISVSF